MLNFLNEFKDASSQEEMALTFGFDSVRIFVHNEWNVRVLWGRSGVVYSKG
jgi:hypothetical protein